MFIYYRNETGRELYRVDGSPPALPDGGHDLSEVPEGPVTRWNGSSWEPAELPPVGQGKGEVRHTKNTAGIGAV